MFIQILPNGALLWLIVCWALLMGQGKEVRQENLIDICKTGLIVSFTFDPEGEQNH
jgi:hypothetical protein